MLLISLIPHPHHRLAYVIELVAGVGLLVGSVLLWRHRARLGSRALPTFDSHGRSSWVIGATITAIELPTAFPYFAAIAAVVGADVGAVRTILLLVVFNLCFIAPLLGILAVLTFAGNRSERLLTTGREFLERHWPTVLACVGVLAGVFVMLLGITGLTGSHHNGFGRLMHRLRHRLVHPLK